MGENQGAMLAIETDIKWCVDDWAKTVVDVLTPKQTSTASSGDNNAMFYAVAGAAGNMIWAATCLLAPEFAIPIRVMSFGGAGLASVAGVLAAMSPDQPVSGPTPPLVNAMSGAVQQVHDKFLEEGKLRDLKEFFYRKINSEHPDWIAKYGTSTNKFRETIWEYLFKSPYGEKGAGYGVSYASKRLHQALQKSLDDYYAYVKERYKVYEHQVFEDAWTQYPARFNANDMDRNEFIRNNYMKKQLMPNVFIQWLNTDTQCGIKLQAFKAQHLIP